MSDTDRLAALPLTSEDEARERARHGAMHRCWSPGGHGPEVRAGCSRCRIWATLDAVRGGGPRPTGCGECQGWPGHHPGCSKYGIPRTEAGAELLRMLEDSIYRGGGRLGGFARSDIVAIEDEAEVRAANREVAALPPGDDLALLRLGFVNGYLAAANDGEGIDAEHLLRAMHIALDPDLSSFDVDAVVREYNFFASASHPEEPTRTATTKDPT